MSLIDTEGIHVRLENLPELLIGIPAAPITAHAFQGFCRRRLGQPAAQVPGRLGPAPMRHNAEARASASATSHEAPDRPGRPRGSRDHQHGQTPPQNPADLRGALQSGGLDSSSYERRIASIRCRSAETPIWPASWSPTRTTVATRSDPLRRKAISYASSAAGLRIPSTCIPEAKR
jgi:hypothetical protein